MAQKFGIITTCMGRLEHLKLSLPKMVSQVGSEVIVVDYSCPQRTGEYVRSNFPSVRVVSLAGKTHFSNWEARNAGASVSRADVLVFVDADTLLADGAIDWLAEHLPSHTHGFFRHESAAVFNRSCDPLALNQLKGFHVVPAATFRRACGYDEVFQGYASGADTDLEDRLRLIGVNGHALDPCIIQSVIEHDLASRLEHHASSMSSSYCAGLLYRTAKLQLLKLRRSVELDLPIRHRLYAAAARAAATLAPATKKVRLIVAVEQNPVLMPRQLGCERASQTVRLLIEVLLEGKRHADGEIG